MVESGGDNAAACVGFLSYIGAHTGAAGVCVCVCVCVRARARVHVLGVCVCACIYAYAPVYMNLRYM